MVHSYQPESAKLYNQTWLVLLLCLVVFPLGLYGLWKSKAIQPRVKLVLVGASAHLLYKVAIVVTSHL